jgi:murein DD-endopeptidase MepM/ murein hydrolase activator NlpD
LAAPGSGAAGWPGPTLQLRQPDKFIGPGHTARADGGIAGGKFSRVDVTLEQNGKSFPIFTLDQQNSATVKQETADRLYVMRRSAERRCPSCRTVRRGSSFTPRDRSCSDCDRRSRRTTRDVQVRLQPPQVAVLSQFHYINHGGSEFVVYRATPEDVQSGVRVDNKEYPGFPAKGAGITTSDPALRVAFFALLFDQDLNAPITVFARDPAGNQAVAPLDHMVFPKPYAKSKIEIDDRFIGRVVPAIAANSPNEGIDTSDLVKGFLTINRDLRARTTPISNRWPPRPSPDLQFRDAFQQLGNSQVEAKFADTRTYFYKGKEIDTQVHLGFDLAVTANVPIVASQRGTVVHASDLGIYGNCVIIDHGMGVQSLYGHLSSIGVKVGDKVEKGQQLGRSGMTGLAGGDHLHFTMIVGGQQVTPVDWWSAQWLQDRVLRKIREAGGSTATGGGV